MGRSLRMTAAQALALELEKYACICFYPSCGTDVSDLDFFGSGRLPLVERRAIDLSPVPSKHDPLLATTIDPDVFLHSDVTFFQEFAAGKEIPLQECGIHGSFEILEFRELPPLSTPNRIYGNYEHSGRCFVYTLRLRNSQRVKTLIFALCENESLVSNVFFVYGLKVPVIWSRSWNGGQTYGTWLANVLDRLHTKEVFTDWLCIPGLRGQPPNPRVAEAYPELMCPTKVTLIRNDHNHWIDEGAHGWVEEFRVKRQ